MKKRLYLAAVNNRYGVNAFLPYAAGLMWGYARMRPEVAEVWEVPTGGLLYTKEPIDRALSRLDRPDVLALSCYIWNWEWCKALAQATKKKWPACAIVVGGVQVPEGGRVLDESVIDFAIYGEGEGAFADFLSALTCERPDYASCGSLVLRSGADVVINPRRAEVPIEDIPSPYLDGLFDELVTDSSIKWQALQETNRGCPYACTFCAWGAASLSKLRQFPVERLLAEFEWMGRHRIEFCYNCDANFGILKRDIDLVEALVKTKEKYGSPTQFRAAYAKNSNDVVFDVSRKLHQAGMLKATTLALQSMDDGVLGNIKRKNIRYDRLTELSAKYEAEGISTYSEIIVGLPGETLASYVAGLDLLLDAGQHDGISIYLCMLLENTEMATRESRERYGIESVEMKAMLYHGTPIPGVVEEIQETVVGTRDMPRDDLRLAVLYGWVVQAFHAFGLTQHIARGLRESGVAYSDFYMPLLGWFSARPSVGGREIARVAALWDGAVAGVSWNAVDVRFGEVSWPPEEWLFLHVACDSDRFYDELEQFCEVYPDGARLVLEQREKFLPPRPGYEEIYAREAVWYGRKGSGAALRRRA